MRTDHFPKEALLSRRPCILSVSGREKRLLCLSFSIAIALLLQSCTPPAQDFETINTALPSATTQGTPANSQAPQRPILPIAEDYAGPTPPGAITRLGRGNISDIAISPNSDRFAVAASIGVYVVDMATTALLWSMETAYPVRCIAFSPDGKTIAISLQTDFDDRRNPIFLLSAVDGQLLQELEGHMAWVNDLAFTPDGSILFSASQDATLIAWDSQSGEKLQILGIPYEARNLSINHLAVSPDGATIAAAAQNKEISVWDWRSARKLHSLQGSAGLAFSPDGMYLATAACGYMTKGAVTLWQGQNALIVFEQDDLNACALSVAFSPDGEQLVSSYSDGTFVVWDAEWGDRYYAHKSITEPANYVTFSPDGTHLLTWASNGEIFIRDAQTWDVTGKIQAHFYRATNLAYSPNTEQVAIIYEDGSLLLWEPHHSPEPRLISRNSEGLYGIAFSPDGKLLATGGEDQAITIWNTISGERQHIPEAHSNWIFGLAFAPNGGLLASAGADRSLTLWNPSSAERFLSHDEDDTINEIAFSPDGRHLAYGTGTRIIRILDVESWQELYSMQIETYGPLTLRYSPDGGQLAAGADFHTVVIWDTTTGEELLRLRAEIELDYEDIPVSSVAYSPDGSLLAAGLLDGSVLVYEMQTQKLIYAFKGHRDMISALAFLSEHAYLVSASLDGTIVVWQLGSW